jgi:hypothetical protein
VYTAAEFDREVERQRGLHAPKACHCPKSDATPEQWAAHLDYRKVYTKKPEVRERKRSRREWAVYRARHSEKHREAERRRRSKPEIIAKATALRRDYRNRSDKDRIASMNRYRSLSPEQRLVRNEKRRAWENTKMRTDRQYSAAKSLRARIYHALKKGWKAARTIELLGCPVDECLSHIEGQWLPGMSWENWGVGRDNSTWHIDHITPVTAFDLTTEEGQRAAFSHKNLQPFWGSDNIRKGGA